MGCVLKGILCDVHETEIFFIRLFYNIHFGPDNTDNRQCKCSTALYLTQKTSVQIEFK